MIIKLQVSVWETVYLKDDLYGCDFTVYDHLSFAKEELGYFLGKINLKFLFSSLRSNMQNRIMEKVLKME